MGAFLPGNFEEFFHDDSYQCRGNHGYGYENWFANQLVHNGVTPRNEFSSTDEKKYVIANRLVLRSAQSRDFFDPLRLLSSKDQTEANDLTELGQGPVDSQYGSIVSMSEK